MAGRQKKRVNNLQVQLVNTRLELALLEEQTANLRTQYQLARGDSDRDSVRNQRRSPEAIPVSLESTPDRNCCDNTIMSLYFRTGSATIEDHDHELIASFARLSRNIPDPVIEITGYADRNGDAEANLQLSRDRTLSIKQLLSLHGINNTAITTVAHGETRPLHANQSLENDFFDRRVILRLRNPGQLMLTNTTDPQL